MGYNRVRNHVRRMYDEQDGKCFYCETPDMFIREDVSKSFYQANRHLRATFDHVIPKAHGGTYRRENGVCACSYCNSKRGHTPFDEFVKTYDAAMIQKIRAIQARAVKVLSQRQIEFEIRRQAEFRISSFLLARFAEQISLTIEETCVKYIHPDAYAKIIKGRI